jgi:SpoIID/LytB domain protein
MPPRFTRRLFAVLALSAAAFVLPIGNPTANALPGTLTVEGHGWGHGHGMGQYGALGYAIDHGWSYLQILQHYYSNTTAGTTPNADILVRLEALNALDLIVRADSAFTLVAKGTSQSIPAGAALRFRKVGAGTFDVDSAPSGANSCAGPWTLKVDNATGTVGARPPSAAPASDRTKMLQVCTAAGVRWYRGTLRAVDDGAARAVNRVLLEDYLRGVVPRESPASWGSLGGGRGSEALKAQSVVARSYGRSEHRYGYAHTCDTTACQVYGGVAVREGSTVTPLEHTLSDAAIAATAGQVRMLNNAVAVTEFSSSTGGYSAGGTFPAVADAGDDVSLNPNHNWSVNVARSTIEAKFPAVGTLAAIDVTRRNGLGDLGGRVETMVLRGSKGSQTISGDTFRVALGLKSNWFHVVNAFSTFPAVGMAANHGGNGYWVVASDGGVYAFSGAPFYGGMGGKHLNSPMVDIAAPPSGAGYWLVGGDGGVFSFKRQFYGSTGNLRLNKPVVGMAAHPSGKGYWFVASDGGVFSYGAGKFHGSMGGKPLNQPVVGMAPTPSGNGYWLVARDGGIFSFGDAQFYGSTGNIRLNKPIVAMAAHHTGKGYWFVASDGGVFSFGAADFKGSTGKTGVPSPISDMARTTFSGGYWLVARDGSIYPFGTAKP